MPRFCANVSLLFTELPFLERFAAAAQHGFAGVEFMFPYDVPAAAIAAELKAHRLTPVLFNLSAGDWPGGERGLSALPARVDDYRASVSQALDYALALDCKRLHCLAGIATGPEAHATYVANLRYAADALRPHGITLLIEPINTRDVPGYFLTGTRQAHEILREVGADNLRLQFDCYHMQIMQGDLTSTIDQLLPDIGHVQIADTPGRHEPGTGEINYPFVFQHLDRIGYDGWVGCEYRPKDGTATGLGWLASYRPGA